MIKDNFYIITGGPGSGKTTLLEGLLKKGLNHVPEVAREIIKEQMQNNGNALPWGDTDAYSKLMIDRSIADFKRHSATKEVLLFDRGILDTIAYQYLLGKPIPKNFQEFGETYRYNQKVYLLPPWKEIYQTDSERKQDFEEAMRTYEVMKKTYLEYNYQIIEIPKGSIDERVIFVLKNLPKEVTSL